jgi:TRAP-type C4-dicarboxylate transport system substrate-binding protein
MANVAPEGTVWAHAFKEFSREVSEATRARVQVKWYLGGIAGDEPEVLERMKRGQLDGAAFTLLCERLAPSMKVMRPFDDRAEHDWVMNKLRPRIDAELDRLGLVGLGVGTLGTTLLFTRQRVGSLDDLRKLRLWVYTTDDILVVMAKHLGLHTVPTSLDEARAAADAGKIDGFLVIPAAVFAYQWLSRLRYFTPDVHLGMPSGCIVMTKKTWERLSADDRPLLRDRLEKLALHIGDFTRAQDEKLLGGLFEKQGLTAVPSSDGLRALLTATRRAQQEAIGELVPAELVTETRAWSEQYRKR